MVDANPVVLRKSALKLAKAEGLDDLGDIAGERSDAHRLLPTCSILAQHKTVILDRRAAARSVDHDGVEPGRQALAFPSIDVGASEIESGGFPPEMVDERPATAAAFGHDHFATMPGQKPDRRFVDFRCQNPLRAAGQSRCAHSPIASRGKYL